MNDIDMETKIESFNYPIWIYGDPTISLDHSKQFILWFESEFISVYSAEELENLNLSPGHWISEVKNGNN